MEPHVETVEPYVAKRRSYRRMSVTLHFAKGQDDDLIQLIEAIPVGERAGVLKKALRGVLSGNTALQTEPSPALDEVNGKLDWMQQALTDLPGYLERIISQIPHSAGPVEAQPVETVAPDVLADRAAKLKQRKW